MSQNPDTLDDISEQKLLSNKNLDKSDLDNIMTGLGAVYLKKHYIKFAAKHPTLTKSRNDKFMKMISSEKFINNLMVKIKAKVLSNYGDKFTEQDIDYQFETDLINHKDVFLERVRIELDRHGKKASVESSA